MAKTIFMRFPGGLGKALTLSYDDGVEQDIALCGILDEYGLKCTFNINSGRFSPEGKVFPTGTIHRVMTDSRAYALFADSPHEVAVHTYSHPHLETMTAPQIAYEVIKDREILEARYGKIIRGMAYPYGTYNDEAVDVLKTCGISYARTTRTTEKFDLPSDRLRLDPTCHHKNPNLMALAEKFLDKKVTFAPQMFYLWGHSYEFEADNNWEVIGNFAKSVSGRPDIWYATNIEIFDYIDDYSRLIFSANTSFVTNPTAREIWFAFDGKDISVKPKPLKYSEKSCRNFRLFQLLL